VLQGLFRRYHRLPAQARRERVLVIGDIWRRVKLQLGLEAELVLPALCPEGTPETLSPFESVLCRQYEIDEVLSDLVRPEGIRESRARLLARLEERLAAYRTELAEGRYGTALESLPRERSRQLGSLLRERLQILERGRTRE
jgi:hypothetical protein